MSSAVSSRTFKRRPQITKSAPKEAKCIDISLPRPVPPPVTRILFPFNKSFLNIISPL